MINIVNILSCDIGNQYFGLNFNLGETSDLLKHGYNASIINNQLVINGIEDVYYNYPAYTYNQCIYVDFNLLSTSSIIHVYKLPYSDSIGRITTIDFSAKRIKIHANWVNPFATIPTDVKNVVINIDVAANDRYTIELEELYPFVRLILRNKSKNQKQVIGHFNYNGFRGTPGFKTEPGCNIAINKFSLRTKTPSNVKVLCYGDSITENKTFSATAKWTYLLSSVLKNSCYINAKAGYKSSYIISISLYDLLNFRPDYVQILIGTNDSEFNTWLININQIISSFEATGATIVLCTLPPYASKQTYINQVNAWIRASGYNYIDYNYVLTQNNDGATWITAYDNGDGIHPSVAAQPVMYNEIVDKVGSLYGIS